MLPITAGRLLGALLVATLAGRAGAAVFEIGIDDRRISFMGGSGETGSSAEETAVAFDPSRERFLLVWSGFESRDPEPPESGIYAQLVEAATGEPVGARLRVGVRAFSPPGLVFNQADDEYYLVYDAAGSGVDILGQRLSGATAEPIGPATRLQDPTDAGLTPAVAFDAERGQFLVAWSGYLDGGLESEIYVQRVDAASGMPIGIDDQRITAIGPTGDPSYFAGAPRVAYNAVADEFLVAFLATPPEGPGQISDHFEVFAQRLDASTGTEVGPDDFRVSAMGAPEDSGTSAGHLDLAYGADSNQYLVVWEGTPDDPRFGGFETEIFSQRLDGTTGTEIGIDDLLLTEIGGLGDPNQNARRPRVIHDPGLDRFLLVASAYFRISVPESDGEIVALEVDAASGTPAGEATIVSQSGGEGDAGQRAFAASLAAGGGNHALIVVWHGESDEGGMISGEREVFAQRVVAGALFADGFERGGTGAWSLVAAPATLF